LNQAGHKQGQGAFAGPGNPDEPDLLPPAYGQAQAGEGRPAAARVSEAGVFQGQAIFKTETGVRFRPGLGVFGDEGFQQFQAAQGRQAQTADGYGVTEGAVDRRQHPPGREHEHGSGRDYDGHGQAPGQHKRRNQGGGPETDYFQHISGQIAGEELKGLDRLAGFHERGHFLIKNLFPAIEKHFPEALEQGLPFGALGLDQGDGLLPGPVQAAAQKHISAQTAQGKENHHRQCEPGLGQKEAGEEGQAAEDIAVKQKQGNQEGRQLAPQVELVKQGRAFRGKMPEIVFMKIAPQGFPADMEAHFLGKNNGLA